MREREGEGPGGRIEGQGEGARCRDERHGCCAARERAMRIECDLGHEETN